MRDQLSLLAGRCQWLSDAQQRTFLEEPRQLAVATLGSGVVTGQIAERASLAAASAAEGAPWGSCSAAGAEVLEAAARGPGRTQR